MMNAKNPSDRTDADALSSNNRLTDVDRYLLDDPSLDRDAFELRMADDFALCERVAQAVEHLRLMHIAAKSIDVTTTIHVQSKALPSVRDSASLYAIASIATAILIGVFSFTSSHSTKSDSSNDQRLAMIADSWIDASLESVDEATTTAGISAAESTVSADSDSDSESSDWMFDAAREFYLEHQNEAAG